MSNKFRVNTLVMSGNLVTANSNSIFVNGSEVQGAGTNIVGLMSTGSHSLINSITGASISGGLSITGAFNINAGSNITLTQQGANTLSIAAAAGGGTTTNGVTGISINGATAISGAISINSNSGIFLSQVGNTLNISQTGWYSKSITIENPVPGDSISLFYTQQAIRVQKVQSIVRGAGLGSGLFSIRSDPDRSVAGTELLVGGFSTTGRNQGDSFTSFSNSTISGNNWIWLQILATGQTLSGLHETLFYTNLY